MRTYLKIIFMYFSASLPAAGRFDLSAALLSTACRQAGSTDSFQYELRKAPCIKANPDSYRDEKFYKPNFELGSG